MKHYIVSSKNPWPLYNVYIYNTSIYVIYECKGRKIDTWIDRHKLRLYIKLYILCKKLHIFSVSKIKL